MKSRILVFLTALLAVTQVWAISGSGTSANPYLISSKSDWDTFAGYVNNGTKSNAYARQTADISGITTIVGTSSHPFTGQYDGQGYTINNVNISASTDNVGLFGYVDGASAVIENIILTSGTVKTSGQNVGSIAGYLGNGIVRYCANGAQVSSTNSSTSTRLRCGGIVGYMPSSKSNTVTYCENYGAVTANLYVGGVVGSAGGGTITYCRNYGTVTCSSNSYYCGGIVAYISGATLTNNHNGGNVNATSYTGSNTKGFIIRGDQNSIDASNTFLNDMQLIIKGTTYQHSNGAKPVTNWNNGATGVDTNPVPHTIGSYRFGTLGSSVYYLFNTGTKIMTVKGTGAMTTYYAATTYYPLEAFDDEIEKVVIESGVTSIAPNCFTYCSNLTEITLPEGITTIGKYAFNYCKKLSSISLPGSLTTIDEYAFSSCTGLTTVTIPSKVTTLGSSSDAAFWKCDNVTDVICLADPTKLTWGGSSFKDFINSPAKTTRCHVPSAKLSSFQSRCSNANVTFVPYTATGTCGTNASWTYDGTNKNIYVFGSGAMNNYASASSEPYYSYRSSATSIIVANGVTSIGQNAFNGFSSVTSVTIPEGITSVGANAFANCSSLTTVTFPSTITQIGSGSTGSFTSSNNITDVYIDVDPANLTWKYTSSDFKASKGTTIHVPYCYYAAYTSKFSSINATFVHNTPTPSDIFTISYTLNGGSVSSANPTTYNISTSTFTLNNPTKTGYTFAGWTGTGLASATTTVTIAKGSYGDRSYTANWTPTSYTISYTLNGGSVATANPTSYNIESSAITLNNPTKTGYTFAGWTGTGLASASKSVTIAAGSTGNRSYTATWTANTYTVTLNKQSGTGGSSSVTATYGSAMPSATMPTRAHYTFGGYYTSTGGSGTQYYTSAGASARNWDKTSATTLYAKWTACPTATVTPPTAKTLTYTGTAQALVNAGSASGGTLQYKLSSGSWGASIPTATTAGTYTVYYRVVADDTHTDNAGSSVSVTINKAALTCTADDKSVTYGANPPTYTATYSGWKNSETASVLSGSLSYSCSYTKGSNAGSYTITPSGVTATNYTVTFKTGTLTVNKAASSVISAPTAKSLVYNGSAQTLVYAGTASGGTMNYSLNNSTWSSSLPTATTAGTYTVYYKVVGDGNHNDTSVSSITVYIDYTIAYTLGGGSVASANPTRYNVTTNSFTLNNPTWTGYTFAGWTGTGLASATTTVTITKGSTGNRSYTATWTRNEVSLTDGEGVTGLSPFVGLECDVTYLRSFTSGKPSTVCLPFAYEKKEGDGSFYEFTGIDIEDGEYIATMTEPASSTLTANTPYLYLASATGSMDFSGTYTIPAELTAGSTTSDDWTFVGTYETVSWIEAPTGIYGFSAQNVDEQGINQGEFVKVGAYVRVKPMRCYLMYKNGNEDYNSAQIKAFVRKVGNVGETLPERISVRLIDADGELTTIGTLHTPTGEVTLDSDTWYTLDGKCLYSKPTRKGIYIVKGRKVVIN